MKDAWTQTDSSAKLNQQKDPYLEVVRFSDKMK